MTYIFSKCTSTGLKKESDSNDVSEKKNVEYTDDNTNTEVN